MKQTLKVTAKQVVVFNTDEIGVFNGTDNIGLGVNADQLVCVSPVSDQEVELHVNVPLGYEPDLIDDMKWEIY